MITPNITCRNCSNFYWIPDKKKKINHCFCKASDIRCGKTNDECIDDFFLESGKCNKFAEKKPINIDPVL